MEYEGPNGLLEHADVLGDVVESAGADTPPARPGSHDDLPMTEEQAAFIAHLRRRIGRAHDSATLTFAQAKRCIAALLDELAP